MTIQYDNPLFTYNSGGQTYNRVVIDMLSYEYGFPYEDAAAGYEMLLVDYDSAFKYNDYFIYGGDSEWVVITTSFVAELNRLANGGIVYRGAASLQAAQGAANSYAGTTGLGLVAALNKKADINRTPAHYKGLTAICNELGLTTGKSAIEALRNLE